MKRYGIFRPPIWRRSGGLKSSIHYNNRPTYVPQPARSYRDWDARFKPPGLSKADRVRLDEERDILDTFDSFTPTDWGRYVNATTLVHPDLSTTISGNLSYEAVVWILSLVIGPPDVLPDGTKVFYSKT